MQDLKRLYNKENNYIYINKIIYLNSITVSRTILVIDIIYKNKNKDNEKINYLPDL